MHFTNNFIRLIDKSLDTTIKKDFISDERLLLNELKKNVNIFNNKEINIPGSITIKTDTPPLFIKLI
jgi:hypothetical protein